MKRTGLALAGLALVGIAPALADNTDTKTVTVSGTIVAPLELTVSNNLTMPHLVKPSTGEPATTVSVACGASNATNTVVYGGQGNPFAAGSAGATAVVVGSANAGALTGAPQTGTCAVLTVAGDSNYFFQVTTGTITAPSTGGVTISSATCYKSDGSSVSPNVQLAAGAATLRCGAAVSATSAAVSYTDGSFGVTVTYD